MTITTEEKALINSLSQQLLHYRIANKRKQEYYDGKNEIKNLAIGVPKMLAGLKVAMAWAKTTVDCLDKRMSFEGFNAPSEFGLDKIIKANHLLLKVQQANKEALKFGTSYMLLGKGDSSVGEADPLITVESSNTTVAAVNPRSGQISSLLKVTVKPDAFGSVVFEFGSLVLASKTIYFEYKNFNSLLETVSGDKFETTISLISEDLHELGFVPAVKFVNNPQGASMEGESEITRSVIYNTDAAQRRLLNGEVASELFATPARAYLNVDMDAFLDADGKPTGNLNSYMSSVTVIPASPDGGSATATQFAPSSPAPFIEWIKTYAQAISGETGIPISRLGYPTANPASADAIKADEVELVRNVKLRMTSRNPALIEVAKLAILLRDGFLPENWEDITPIWAKPEMTTFSADVDAITKLISAGAITPTSKIGYNKLGFSEAEQAAILAELEEAKKGGALLNNIAVLANQARNANPTLDALNAAGGNIPKGV